jgi:hypothetical protein
MKKSEAKEPHARGAAKWPSSSRVLSDAQEDLRLPVQSGFRARDDPAGTARRAAGRGFSACSRRLDAAGSGGRTTKNDSNPAKRQTRQVGPLRCATG